jgi:cytidylate kinase
MAASRGLAEKIGERLGYRIITREQIIEHARAYGLEETGMAETGFMEGNPPHFWDRQAAQRRLYLIYLRASLMDYIVKGDIVYVGHLSQFILADVPKILRIRIDATVAQRLEALTKDSAFTEPEAQEHIKNIDEKRRAWAQFLYGVDYAAPLNYDMVLNMAHMTLDSMAEIIETAVKRPEWEMDDDASNQIQNIYLASQVTLHLAKSKRTRGMELAVDCDVHTKRAVIRGVSPLIGSKTWEEDIKEVVLDMGSIETVEVFDLR